MKNNTVYPVLLLFIASLFICCNTNSPGKTAVPNHTDKKEDLYPPEVVKLGLQKEYDNTKWTLYCIHCDDTCRFADSLHMPDTLTFASLDLQLYTINRGYLMGRTVELDFYFYYGDIKCNLKTMRNKEIAHGIIYQADTGYVISYASLSRQHDFREERHPSKLATRYLEPLQPDVVRYIQQNEAKLNPWFRNEAIKRKVLKAAAPGHK